VCQKLAYFFLADLYFLCAFCISSFFCGTHHFFFWMHMYDSILKEYCNIIYIHLRKNNKKYSNVYKIVGWKMKMNFTHAYG